MESLSVIINTKNAAATLEKALKSVKFANEVIVVDMMSQDKTVGIAKSFTKKVFNHPDVGYVEPVRNFAINKATSDWILIIDADEEVPAKLKSLIKEILSKKTDVDCFYIARKNIIFNKWIEKTGWWPDYQLRLFRTGAVDWSDEIHSFPITTGTVKELPAKEEYALVHHNYQTLEQFVDRLNRYTSFEVGKAEPNKPVKPDTLIRNFSDELFTRLFVHKGIDEGMHGVGLAFLQAFYQLVVQLKVWQDQNFSSTKAGPVDTIASFRLFQKELNYWIADWQVKNSSGLKQLYWQIRRKLLL